MDADCLFRRIGMANHLAWAATATVGLAKHLAGPFSLSASFDSSLWIAAKVLSKHDLGGPVADALFHHRYHGNMGQPGTTHTSVGTGGSGYFLSVCFQKEKSSWCTAS